MPLLVQMSDVVLRAQRRCDMENNDAIDRTVGGEWYAMAREQYGELYGLVASTGMRYFDATHTYTSDGTTNVLAMPTDHFETISLDWIINTSTGRRISLTEIMAQERSRWSGMLNNNGETLAYELVASSFLLYPTPPAARTFELRYVPQAPDLTAYTATQTIDVISSAGEGFMYYGLAVKAHAKLEGDPALAIRERDKYAEQLVEWAQLRALNEPRRMIADEYEYDIRRRDPGGWWNR